MTLFCTFFTSCENGTGDDLKGVWKFDPNYYAASTSNNWEGVSMSYVFDGKGNYSFTITEPKYGTRNAKGTYDHLSDSKLVRLHEIYTNPEGVTKEYDSDIWLDITAKPATLSSTRLFDEEIAVIVFVKQ